MPWIPCSNQSAAVDPSAEGSKGPRFHPKLLKTYEVPSKPVGEGGFGVVYLATHRKSGEKHAIKVIAASREINASVSHEVEIMQTVNKRKSPHIVKILGYSKDSFQHYLVLQACEGGELFDRIADHVFTEEEAAGAVLQILRGIKACHDAGVCHRDMKPENVLYSTRAQASPLLITDFGLSCRCKPGAASIGDWCGTAPYMAPEVFHCAKQGTPYGPECDLWSIGVLVYILLTGYMPFDGPEKTIEANVCAGKYSMSSSVVGNISEPARDFIRRLLTVDPKQRLTAEQAMRHVWIAERNARSGEAVNSQVAARLRRFAKQTRLEKRLRFVIAQTLSIDEIAGLKAEFEKLDADGSGKISHQELQEILQSKEGSFKYQGLIDVMESLDTDMDGQVDIVEFVAATLDIKVIVDDEKLRAAFQRMDLNQDGLISTAELMAQMDGDPIVYDLMTQGDKDKDGKLDIEEFRSMVKERVSAAKVASRLPTRGGPAMPAPAGTAA